MITRDETQRQIVLTDDERSTWNTSRRFASERLKKDDRNDSELARAASFMAEIGGRSTEFQEAAGSAEMEVRIRYALDPAYRAVPPDVERLIEVVRLTSRVAEHALLALCNRVIDDTYDK